MGCGCSHTKTDEKMSEEKVHEHEEFYYQNVNINSDEGGPKEKIQLNVELRNAAFETGYTISIVMGFDKKGKVTQAIGKTKEEFCNDNRIIQFEYFFVLDYFFEKQQYIQFNVRKGLDVYTANITLGKLMGSRGQKLTLPLGDSLGEELYLTASPIKISNISIYLSFSIKCPTYKKIFFLVKKKKTQIQEGKNKQWWNIYKSELQTVCPTPVQFRLMKIPSIFFCNGDYDHPILIEFHNTSDEEIAGVHNTSVNSLQKEKSFKVGNLQINYNIELVTDYTFIDYLRGGTQLSLTIGIDFTGSNGHPCEADSLHRINTEGKPNQYQLAIRSCGDILAYYDHDQIFPVYGYGAILPGSDDVSMCFPLNLSDNPDINLINQVLNIYRNNMPKLTFSGPTYFSPMIRNVMDDINAQNSPKVYHVLLILTDGMINDMEETISALVDASTMPLSVIIVGVGKADFYNMNVLDSDNGSLSDITGRKAVRDIVQFVPFSKFSCSGKRLAEEVLAELPRQLIDYYRLINIPPDSVQI